MDITLMLDNYAHLYLDVNIYQKYILLLTAENEGYINEY